MVTDAQMLLQIDAANQFIDKSYLGSLQEYRIESLDERVKRHNLTRLYRIDKIVYDKNEDTNEKLISVFHSVMPFCKNVILILCGKVDHVDLYLGVRTLRLGDAETAGNVLHDAFLGNFPGSKFSLIETDKIARILSEKDRQATADYSSQNIAYINTIPSERSVSKQGEFIQGLEKFIDTMRGSEYICEILASPIRDDDITTRMNGFEDLYSALFPFSKKTSSHGHNQASTLTEGISESISNSISTGIAKATGKNTGYAHGKNSGFNMGMYMLLNFGFTSGTHDNWQTGTTESDTTSSTQTRSDVMGKTTTTSQTRGITDNLTIEFRNKSIEDLLEKIDRHIKRMKAGSSYGVWEVASYFIAKKKTTAAIAASTYRSLLLGEETGIEKSNFILFDSADEKTAAIEESLMYCEHPTFLIPLFEANTNFVPLSPTNYVSGKELSLLLNLPRKSVSGIMVTEMAEFGRNVLSTDSSDARIITMGRIFHMGQKENAPVTLNIDSLTSHCFITGSTGSGKSNTVYKLIEEVTKTPYKIPFLVIEPAKGEYRNEFRNVPGINLFSTNPYIDQMLKLNPFAFCEGIHILEHLDRIVEIFNGCWEMYAAMPAILKEAIEKAYVSKGWDLLNSIFVADGEPVFPTFIDVLQELPKIINSSDYSAETKGDYIGALVTRVNSMTNGIYGQIFCDEFEVDSATLFDGNTVVDLSRVGSSETKALIMGVLILKLTEYRLTNATRGNSVLKHLTIIEEAHNILKNSKSTQTTAGNNVVSKSVEMLVNSIAEMRTYGEGFVIVDQSPTSVDVAAIKNTNTKIIMRLPEEEDCKIAGHSVSLSEQQTDELAKLETGVAVFMQNNWAEPVLAQIDEAGHPYDGYENAVTFEKLKEFRSMVLSVLIDQFEKTDEQDISKVIRKVEEFDIAPAKKAEMCRMLSKFGVIMTKQYDSILLGRTLLRLAGCNDVFRKAEEYLKYEEDADGNVVEKYTEDSITEWFRYIDTVMPQYTSIQDAYRDTMQQYILHSKKFEKHDISYSALYRQIYKR